MRKFVNAFRYAGFGMLTFFRHERNGKIQLLATIITVIAGVALGVSLQEWMWLLVCIATVLSFEMMNTALEKLCNIIEPRIHPEIKLIKDVAAAAVLMVAIVSATIAVIIFFPKILSLI